MDDPTRIDAKPLAPETVLYGEGLFEGELPGAKRHYWGMLHSLTEHLIRTAGSPNESEAKVAKSTLAVWSKGLFGEAGEFAREDVNQLLMKHGIAKSLEELWAWNKSR